MRDGYYRRTYGLTADEVDALIEKQGGTCAICGRTPNRLASWHIDHDHHTGEIRGALCNRCNQALGLFDEDPELLELAAAYLRSGNR